MCSRRSSARAASACPGVLHADADSPLHGLEMPVNVAGGLKTREDERILQPPNDVFHHLGLLRVSVASSDDRVKNLDQVEHVLVNLGAGGPPQIEEVEQLDVERDPLPADHDVVVMNVSVIIAPC